MNEASKALIVVHGQAVLVALKDFETKLFIQQFEAINQQRGQCNWGQGRDWEAKFMNKKRKKQKHRQGWQDEVQRQL